MKTKVAVLGCGNMGSAIVLGAAKNLPNFSFITYTPSGRRARALAAKVKGKAVRGMAGLENCDWFLIACKPQQYAYLERELKPVVRKTSKIISVMAGISFKRLKKLGTQKIARVMPNTPCLVGKGTCAVFYSGMNGTEKKIVRKLFEPVGEIFEVRSDDQINTATALIGSGPAYFFEFTRLLAEAAAQKGLPRAKAEAMAKSTALGAAVLMLQSQDGLETLRDKVTSKGGTTQAALETFKKRGWEKVIRAAVSAAIQRGRTLGKE